MCDVSTRRRLRTIVLAALLSTSGVSTSGLALLSMPGVSSTANVLSIPGLVQALAPKPHKPARAMSVVAIAAPGVTSTLLQGALNLIPGQTVTRHVEIFNSGNTRFRAITLLMSTSSPVALVSSTTQGIGVVVAPSFNTHALAQISTTMSAWLGHPMAIPLISPLVASQQIVEAPYSGSTCGTSWASVTSGLGASATSATVGSPSSSECYSVQAVGRNGIWTSGVPNGVVG